MPYHRHCKYRGLILQIFSFDSLDILFWKRLVFIWVSLGRDWLSSYENNDRQLFIQQGDLSHILSLSWHDVHEISSCAPNTWPIHGGSNILTFIYSWCILHFLLRFLVYSYKCEVKAILAWLKLWNVCTLIQSWRTQSHSRSINIHHHSQEYLEMKALIKNSWVYHRRWKMQSIFVVW